LETQYELDFKGAKASRLQRSASSPNATSAQKTLELTEMFCACDVIGGTPVTATGTVAPPAPGDHWPGRGYFLKLGFMGKTAAGRSSPVGRKPVSHSLGDG